MNDTVTRELVIMSGIILLLVLVSGPAVFAGSDLLLAFAAGLIIMLGVFGLLIYNREGQPEDKERRTGHRAAFLTAVGVILAGIVTQELTGTRDPWLYAALVSTLAAKFIGAWRRRG